MLRSHAEPFTVHFHPSHTRCEPCAHPQAGPGTLTHRKILQVLQPLPH